MEYITIKRIWSIALYAIMDIFSKKKIVPKVKFIRPYIYILVERNQIDYQKSVHFILANSKEN